MRHRTEQEDFWAGEFGSQYIRRNSGDALLASNLAFFSRALAGVQAPATCLEVGANVGLNLKALRLLFPQQEQFAVEINADAVRELQAVVPEGHVHHASILDFRPDRKFDLVLVKGVLIHLSPDSLKQVYETLHSATRRYLLICEYYNPTPVEVPYRGHSGRLYKRDFCGEILNLFPDFRLATYGFAYHLDESFPQDDITWFLLKMRD